MSDIVERLANHIGRLELDEDDQVALVPRWEVEESIDTIKSLRQQLAECQEECKRLDAGWEKANQDTLDKALKLAECQAREKNDE